MEQPVTQDESHSTGPRAGAKSARSARAWATLLVTLVLALAADLASKSLAFRRVADRPVVTNREDVLLAGPEHLYLLIPRHAPVRVIPGVLEFTLVYNPGAVFGIGAGKRWFFVAFTGVALVAGLLLFARGTRSRDHAAHVGIALILAGGLGNLFDRLMYGCVRDFIHPVPGVNLPFGLSWPGGGSREIWPWVSNGADLFLIIGVGIMVVLAFRAPRKASPSG